MSVNVNSITDSYNAWYDYKYGKNTRGLTSADIAEIETRWKSNLASWKSQAAQDENKYEITDDRLDDAKADGKKYAKNSTGHDGKADTWGTVKGAVGGGAAAIVGVGGAGVAGMKIASTFTKETTGAIKACKDFNDVENGLKGYKGAKTAADAAKNVKDGGGAISASDEQVIANTDKAKAAKGNTLVGAAVFAGVGTLLYAASRIIRSADPNGDDARALQELYDSTLPEAQGNLAQAESDMEDASTRTLELTEEANANNEDTNEEMEEAKVEFDMYREAAEILQEKQRNGVALSGFEQDFLKEVTPILEELGEHINSVAEENTETTQDIYDEIGGYQETFDESAETIAEVQGITDFAAGFDETTVSNTQVMATVADFGAQGGDAVSKGSLIAGVVGMAKMGSIFTFGEGVAMVALSATGTVAGAGASQQFGKLEEEQVQYNQIAQAEIEARSLTQDMDASIQASYEDQIAVYDDNISIVEDLEMEVPDDTAVPEITVSANDSAASDKSTVTAQPSEKETKNTDDVKKNKDVK